ncbi:MAG: hypothetical protein ACU0HS_16695 [Paracoccus sp. (in: a-proteobacteria)]|uniref:hypothetical protein n=1 Tax=Paracoccus sp. TaxID=267 RepID=UPI0040580B3D
MVAILPGTHSGDDCACSMEIPAWKQLAGQIDQFFIALTDVIEDMPHRVLALGLGI